MIFQSDSIQVSFIKDGIAEFKFSAPGSVNKFDQATLLACKQAYAALTARNDVKGMICVSDKPAFIVGADITEFMGAFSQADDVLLDWIKQASDVFDGLEDLPFPTACAINGYALGGGCEWTLAADFRVADTSARIGLPETKLGLIPGFGGTVRLPRLIGADNAMLWITTAKEHRPEEALAQGAIDAVVAPEKLRDAALAIIEQAIAGDLDWQSRRAKKQAPLQLNKTERVMSFTMAKGMVAAQAGKHYPAPMAAVTTIEAAATQGRAEAVALENAAFAKLAKTPQAQALIGVFLADQVVKSKAKKLSKIAKVQPQKAAVLGAGIMGGGIAYQSAYKNVPIVMKDIRDEALALGMSEATKLLSAQVERGRMDARKMGDVLSRIRPTLNDAELAGTQIIVEAVVENPKVKASVLAQVEKSVAADTIITSNTSTISIDLLAQSLSDPSRFCGMHFFNPVHKMPLVEIIRGKDSSDETIASVVSYALTLGKTPIVVNDCPGFFVNRVLFPYFAGLSLMLNEGADYQAIDKVMEKQFGWPMGPAYLLDVVGLDTAHHCTDVMAVGFPTRMAKLSNDPIAKLVTAGRLGQKNGTGFYSYEVDKKGKPKKIVNTETYSLLGSSGKEFGSDEIMARMMIPMVNETIRCLEEGIVASAAEADMALLFGLGFPPFRGGVFRYVDQMGLANFVALADQYADLGEIYQVTEQTRAMAQAGKSFY